MARASKKKAGPLPKNERFLVFAFGGVLLTFGTIMPGIGMAKSIRGYLRTRSHVSVEAEIRQLERVRHTNNRYSTRIKYVYRYAGNDFMGTNVALFGESRSLYPRLSKAHDTSRSIQVWIDPNEPSFTVIERDWHWPEMLLSFVFFGGIAGLGGYLILCGRRGVIPNLNPSQENPKDLLHELSAKRISLHRLPPRKRAGFITSVLRHHRVES